jgi:hypothetical protein
VDPGHLFGRGVPEARIAEQLIAGQSVVAGFAIDELRLQQSLAERRSHAPDVLVLGSSRAMPLSAEAFPGRAVVNASVSSASLEDAIALLELYEGHGLRPRTVLLAIEPWGLNGSLRNPSVALEAELQAGLRRLGRRAGTAYGALPGAVGLKRRWLSLVSPAYFQASLVSLLARGFVGSPSRAPERGRGAAGEATRAGSSRMQPDGSVDWEPVLAERSPAEVEAIARAAGARAPGYLQKDPDPDRVLLLGALLGDLASRGVRVVLWLPPFHPAAYRTLVAGGRGRGLWRGEAEVRALAAASPVPVLGSYDPARSDVAGEDFIDSNHLRRRPANALVAGQMAAAGIDLALAP